MKVHFAIFKFGDILLHRSSRKIQKSTLPSLRSGIFRVPESVGKIRKSFYWYPNSWFEILVSFFNLSSFYCVEFYLETVLVSPEDYNTILYSFILGKISFSCIISLRFKKYIFTMSHQIFTVLLVYWF